MAVTSALNLVEKAPDGNEILSSFSVGYWISIPAPPIWVAFSEDPFLYIQSVLTVGNLFQ